MIGLRCNGSAAHLDLHRGAVSGEEPAAPSSEGGANSVPPARPGAAEADAGVDEAFELAGDGAAGAVDPLPK